MAESALVAHHRFVISSPEEGRITVRHSIAYEAAKERTACVYLAGSAEHALRAQQALRRVNVRVYRAENVREALALLELVDSAVLLVDADFAGGAWPDALRAVERHAPKVEVILAAPVDVDDSQELLGSAVFEVVDPSLRAAELCSAVIQADRYARRLFT